MGVVGSLHLLKGVVMSLLFLTMGNSKRQCCYWGGTNTSRTAPSPDLPATSYGRNARETTSRMDNRRGHVCPVKNEQMSIRGANLITRLSALRTCICGGSANGSAYVIISTRGRQNPYGRGRSTASGIRVTCTCLFCVFSCGEYNWNSNGTTRP